MLQNKTQRKKRTTISTMSSRNFKRLVSMEISRLNPHNNNSSNTTTAWPNEPFASNTNLSPVMPVIKNNCLLNMIINCLCKSLVST